MPRPWLVHRDVTDFGRGVPRPYIFRGACVLGRRLEAAANLEHQAVLGLPAKLWAEAFAVKFEVDL